MTLDEFIEYQLEVVQDFKNDWLKSHVTHRIDFPLELEAVEEWEDQFATYISHKLEVL